MNYENKYHPKKAVLMTASVTTTVGTSCYCY